MVALAAFTKNCSRHCGEKMPSVAAMGQGNCPVFPLNTVLFPGCRLPLQIFEQRYLEMVKNCLKQDSGFTIVLLRAGSEVGAPAPVFEIGTYGRIVDWTSLPNGLLGITVEGEARVRIHATSVQSNNLILGELERLPEQFMPQSDQLAVFTDLLKQLEQHPLNQRTGARVDYSNPNKVIWALCQLLPLDDLQKQALLEIDDPELCMRKVDEMLRELEG